MVKLFSEEPPLEQVLEIAKDKGLTYQRRSQNDNQVNSRSLNPRSTSGMNIHLGVWFNNSKVLVPVTEIVKIPSQNVKLLSAIDSTQVNAMRKETLEAFYQDAPIYLQSMESHNKRHSPFLITLLVNNYWLYNCMLDPGASARVTTKRVMEQLNLRKSRPYYNICAMNSKKSEVHGLIKDLLVHLSLYLDIMIIMDIVLVDVPDAWGMFLSRK